MVMIFEKKVRNIYIEYLVKCGHDRTHVLGKFKEITDITREEARSGRRRVAVGIVGKFNPRAPDIRALFKKHRPNIDYDSLSKEILLGGVFRVPYQRNANLKELSAPSNPYRKKNTGHSLGCYKCSTKRCD